MPIARLRWPSTPFFLLARRKSYRATTEIWTLLYAAYFACNELVIAFL